MAFPAAEQAAPAASSFARRFGAGLLSVWKRAALALEDYPLERIGLAAIAAGIVLRFAAPFFMDFRSDGDTYVAMGHAWALHHEFLMPYGDVTTWGPLPPGYSNHYPPAYPLYLGLVFSVFGYGLWVAKWAAIAMALLALGVCYLTTRDLYGRVPAALVGGLLALEPHLIWVAGSGFSENMVLLFFALTMWAILRSLKDDRYILFAGLFAGLSYLSRSSVGYFFVIAGVGGLAWRLLYRGWRVLLNPWYLGAIAIFLSLAGAWAARNILLFPQITYPMPGYLAFLIFPLWRAPLYLAGIAGAVLLLVGRRMDAADPQRGFVRALGLLGAAGGIGMLAADLVDLRNVSALFASANVNVPIPAWETSSYTRYVQQYAFDRPDKWGYALVRKIPFFLAFLAWYCIPFLPESWRATKRIKEEDTSALWLSIFLVWIIAWVIASMFWVFEQSSLYWFDNHRYVLIGLLPLAWLLVREARWERASTRLRYALLLLSLFAACGAVFLDPVRFSDLRAAETMDPYLHPGDQIGVDGGTIKYAFYAYLTHPEQVTVYGCEPPPSDATLTTGPCHGQSDVDGHRAAFIMSLRYGGTYSGYQLVGTFHQKFSDGGVMTATLFGRDDVIAARGVPVNQVRDYE